MVKVTVVVKVQKLVDLDERCGNDDQCQSNECDNVGNSNGGTCSKGNPGNFCVFNSQCKSGICDNGTCRYPNGELWEDDPNKWRWDKNPDKKCAKEWEKKFITHNGKSYCGREGSKAGRFNERCGNDDQCQSNECDNVGNSKGGTCSKGNPGNFCIFNDQCKSGICDNGTCRYPNQGIWEDDPNK